MLFERLRAVLQQELAAEPEPLTRQLYRELLASSAQNAGRPSSTTRRAPQTCRPGSLRWWVAAGNSTRPLEYSPTHGC